MRQQLISDAVAETLLKASTTFRPDQIRAFRTAMEREENAPAKWVIEKILENAELAEQNRSPLCDDTGIPHVFLEIGDAAVLPAGFLRMVEDGIAQGLRRLPGRPMGVRGSDMERITQEKGLFDEPDGVLPAPIQLRRIPGIGIRVTVLMYGGGPEIRGKTERVFHKHEIAVVKQKMIEWATEGATLLGCQPCVLAFGIGRSQVEAASYSLEALKEADFDRQTELEQEITDAVNQCGVGPLSVHGKTTVLRTFIKVGPQRTSGIRVISLRVGCCFDPRRATCEFETDGGNAISHANII